VGEGWGEVGIREIPRQFVRTIMSHNAVVELVDLLGMAGGGTSTSRAFGLLPDAPWSKAYPLLDSAKLN